MATPCLAGIFTPVEDDRFGAQRARFADPFSSDFLTVMGHRLQVMFCTSSTAVRGVAESAASGISAASKAANELRMRDPFKGRTVPTTAPTTTRAASA